MPSHKESEKTAWTNIRKFMKYLIKKILGKNGFQLKKTSITNFRDGLYHPIDIMYQTRQNSSSIILINIPVSRCRTQIWNTLEKEKSPFVNTIISYQKNRSTNYSTSPLKQYYETYLPESAGEVLRLNGNEKLSRIPPFGYILPWDNQNFDQAIKIREKVALYENKKEGSHLDITAGHTDFGPVSEQKGEIEFKRLIRVTEQIQELGYKENPYLEDGGIRGYFLIGTGNEWCFNIKSGKHRAYALAALGYHSIPVIIDSDLLSVIRTIDIDFWPQVRSSIFSAAEALRLAKNILDS